MNFTVIVLSGIDRNLSIALSVSSAWNPPFIRLLGPPLEYILITYITTVLGDHQMMSMNFVASHIFIDLCQIHVT